MFTIRSYLRGVELIEFKAGGNFQAKSTASDTEFTDIDLSDKDWAGYDEAGVSALRFLDSFFAIGCFSWCL